MIYAVLDTNVIVSALISKKPESATVKVFEAFLAGNFKILYNEEILEEYLDVLSRSKFRIPRHLLHSVLDLIKQEGVSATRISSGEFFPDPDDAVFYEVALSVETAYVVTGNLKHFPKKPQVITPAEMLELLVWEIEGDNGRQI